MSKEISGSDAEAIMREIQEGTPNTPERVAFIAEADRIYAKHSKGGVSPEVRERAAQAVFIWSGGEVDYWAAADAEGWPDKRPYYAAADAVLAVLADAGLLHSGEPRALSPDFPKSVQLEVYHRLKIAVDALKDIRADQRQYGVAMAEQALERLGYGADAGLIRGETQ